MKKYSLWIIWPDGEEMRITGPTANRRKLETAREKLNSKYNDGTRVEIKEK